MKQKGFVLSISANFLNRKSFFLTNLRNPLCSIGLIEPHISNPLVWDFFISYIPKSIVKSAPKESLASLADM